MLPSDLLRTRTSRGRIHPLFCSLSGDDDSDEHVLASRMTLMFEDAQKRHMRKGDLSDVISELESDNDYKLVRGLAVLLERRSKFSLPSNCDGSAHASKAAPADVRRAVFAESSRVGLATSEQRRALIVKRAAELCDILPSDVETMLWADLDENHVLDTFDAISTEDLLLWYNMSLAQTLLFGCTQMEFCIDEGSYWKTVLRAVKMQGLMYVLEYGGCKDSGSGSSRKDARTHIADAANTGGSVNRDTTITTTTTTNAQIKCILDGPLSLFKMTTKYGSAFARLLPVITRTSSWHVDAVISKKTGSGTKLYRFEISSDSASDYLRIISGDVNLNSDSPESFDSSVEQKFAEILRHHLDCDDPLGWRMTREPGPLVSGNKAMMPDFVFERFGRRVYLEIVGFWTPDYIRRKVSKLGKMLDAAHTKSDGKAQPSGGGAVHGGDDDGDDDGDEQKIDMLVGIDSSLLCSQFSEISGLPGVFTFDKKMSASPILDHLKTIDAALIQEAVSNVRITPADLGSDVVLMRDVALRYNIPEEAVPDILARSYGGVVDADGVDADSVVYVVAGPHLISGAKVSQVDMLLKDVCMFDDACRIMQDAGIPEACHADLLSHAGYDVVWQDLNPANAKISKGAQV